MKANSEQGLQIVLPGAAQLPVRERSNGDGGQAGQQVYLDHAAIDDNEDHNIDRPHGHMNEQGLQPQPQQRAKPQRFQRGLQVGKHGL